MIKYLTILVFYLNIGLRHWSPPELVALQNDVIINVESASIPHPRVTSASGRKRTFEMRKTEAASVPLPLVHDVSLE